MGIIDFIFPKTCINCGKTGAYFCSDCLNFVSLDSERICPVCEKPSIGGFVHPRCRGRYSLDGFTSIFAYRGVIKKAITKLKYNFISDLALDMVELFLSFCGEDKIFSSFCLKKPVLVPVPLHPNRERWRGFSQTELLGKMIVDNLGLEFVPDLLIRTKDTKSQVGLGEQERKANIEGAFTTAHGILVSLYPNILLFDDIWTSGATLKEAGRTLRKAGVKNVWGLTLAR